MDVSECKWTWWAPPYAAHRLPCLHQPQPSSSLQPQTLDTSAQVSTQVRRHEERQVLWEDGHSRHVVVQRLAGSHVFDEEHQPQPGASAAQVHTSLALSHTAAEEMLRCCTMGKAERVAEANSISMMTASELRLPRIATARFISRTVLRAATPVSTRGPTERGVQAPS